MDKIIEIIKNENGSIITSIIGMPVLIFLLFAGVQYWGVMTIYQHAESIKYNALSAMEIDGGLTPEKENLIYEKLIDLGAKPESIKISGDKIRKESDIVEWPKEVELRIEFEPEHFNNFTARTLIGGTPGEPIKIGVKGSIVSAKVLER